MITDPLSTIKTLAADLKLAPSTFCLKAVGNAHIPQRLAEGRSVELRTLARIQEFYENEKERRKNNKSLAFRPAKLV